MKKKENPAWGSEQLLRSLLENFLVMLIRNHLKREEKSDDSGASDVKYEEILAYVDAHFTEKLVLDELAFLFNTNRSAFCKGFKAFTGKTLVNYVADKKIDSFVELLSKPNLSLSEIAARLGFESTAYLCRFFKSRTGKTPKEFRAEMRKNESVKTK